jgi:(2Fe-2S) ferredoxin
MNRPDEIKRCYVCVNVTCLADGSEGLFAALKDRLEARGIEVRKEICLGACGMGPNIVMHPKGTWYSAVQPGDIDDIVAHVQGGPAPERLLNRIEPDLVEMILGVLDSYSD